MNLLFEKFLEDPNVYAACELYWRELWDTCDGTSDWRVPWLNTAFLDGTGMGDGNPIFSAVSSMGRAVKVVQESSDFGCEHFTHWVSEWPLPGDASLQVLSISCVLTSSTAKAAAELLRKWARTRDIVE